MRADAPRTGARAQRRVSGVRRGGRGGAVELIARRAGMCIATTTPPAAARHGPRPGRSRASDHAAAGRRDPERSRRPSAEPSPNAGWRRARRTERPGVLPASEAVPEEIEVTCVASGLIDHVDEDPAEVDRAEAERGNG